MIESGIPKFECHCNHEVPLSPTKHSLPQKSSPQLRHCYKELDEIFKRCASVDIDFSKNLTVPVNFESQSLYWCHQQVTVHSGILKCNGEKNYIAHFSLFSCKHDQLFVDNVVKNMIGNANLTSTPTISHKVTIAVAKTSQEATFLTNKSSLIASRSRFFAYGILQVMEKVKLTMLEEWP